MELLNLTVSDLAARIAAREISAVEAADACLRAIDHGSETVRAFLRSTPDVALAQAREADNSIARGEAGPLAGVPIALKDIISTASIPTTCGSRILENYVPQYDATVTTRLRAAGMVLVGKTNMDEFAMGSSTENSAFGPVHNPWDLDRVPGGSSGGSAAAVAARQVPVALGTDTGGSIRQPAAFTGTTGLKPTYGRVSRFGLVAFASSLDQIGPITRTARDAALLLGVIAGRDPLDSTSLPAAVPNYLESLSGDVSGLRLGVPREYFQEGMSPGVERVVREAIARLEALGATVEETTLPHTHYALSTYYIVSPAEAMANLARYDGVRYGLSERGDDIWQMFANTRELGLGTEVKRRILLGTYALSAGYYDAYYRKAQQVRTLVRRDFDEAFARFDALVAPTTPTTAFRIGERSGDPLEMYLSDVYTVPANIAGVCGVSIPAGFDGALPVGLQILGKPLDEARILRIADAFQQVTNFHTEAPPCVGAVGAA
jgi:aspartyl-tRNA(Asn)/glutamyl-tRNA(Gln) amidotransferase subunit A